jgi:hypothetical protein
VFGGLPLTGSASPLEVQRSGAAVVLQIRQRVGAGLPIVVWERSADLETWEDSPGADLLELDRTPIGEGLWEIRYQYEPGDDGEVYLRIKVEDRE